MTDMPDMTLMTKVLQPRRRDDILTRQRLLNRLYEMIDYRLVLISAPAGYGKSTLLVDFADDLEHPVCWYALDAGDQDPHVFIERLVLSLQRRFPGFGTQTSRALAAAADLRNGAPGLVRVLVNEIVETIPQWFVLVLDDYHALGAAPEISAIVSNFIAYQRDQCLTIISSRSTPQLPSIISLVARGGIGGIGQEEMRFEPDEIRQLFRHNYDVELSEEEAEALAEQSEGWVTGLLLTAYTRWQGVLQSWMRARDSKQPIYDYLAQEVFVQQPEEIQRFLTLSSVLKEMSVAVCDEVLGVPNAGMLLDTVEGENLFVTRLEGEENWYRYHHLFRDFLQTRFKIDNPDGWHRMQLKAASWFASRGEVRLAVEHYLAVKAYGEAARLMEEAGRNLFVAGQLATLMAWYRQLPTDYLESVPRLALLQARAAHNLGDYETALSLAEIAERGYSDGDNVVGLAYARLERCEMWLLSRRTDEGLALGKSVLKLVAEVDGPVPAEAHRVIGRAYAARGELEKARRELETALDLSLEFDNVYDSALIRTGLARVAALQGDLDEAIRLHREAVTVWRRLGSDAALADELNDLGFHLYKLGRYDEAMRCFREALTVAQQTGLRRVESYLLVNLSELARDLGLADVAVAYGVQGHSLAKQINDRFLEAYSLDALGQAYRAKGELDKALSAVEDALSRVSSQSNGYEGGRYQASKGVVEVELGYVDTGLEAVASAVSMLSSVGAPLELMRARFLHAWSLHLADRRREAIEALAEVLDMTSDGASLELSHSFGEKSDETAPPESGMRVLVVEGQHALPLLRAAQKELRGAEKTTGAYRRGRYLKEILQQIKTLRATGEELFPQALVVSPQDGPPLRAFAFGVGRVELGEEEIPQEAWGTMTARHLLFYMMIHGPSTREQISDAFWPDVSPRKAKSTFHTTKFRLHQAVGRDLIDYDGHVYALTPDIDIWFDVAEFREHLGAWRRTQDVERLAAAMELYTDDFLTGCYAGWCESEREALRVAGLEVLEILAERFLARRQYRRAIGALQRALTLEPAREVFHQQIMRAYALSGQRSRALAQYKRCEINLRSRLSAAPSQRTTELYSKIMAEVPLE